jgi:hypothetical protein
MPCQEGRPTLARDRGYPTDPPGTEALRPTRHQGQRLPRTAQPLMTNGYKLVAV